MTNNKMEELLQEIDKLKSIITSLQEELRIIKESHERIDDL